MESEWTSVKLKDIISFVVDNRGKTPPTQDSGYPLLEVNAISKDYKFPQYQAVRKYVSQEVYDTKFRKGHPQIGDILVPTVGTLGAVSYVNRSDCCIAQNVVALRANTLLCNNNFLYYILKNPSTRERLLNLNIGGVQPSIKVPHLLDLELDIPSLEEQKQIVSILGALDDKIALNNKINDNLEQQAQALYQKYFSETGNTGELADVCNFSKDKMAVSELSVRNYFSTENMLPDKKGTTEATSLPTVQQTTACHRGNVLVSNIRPYFKKILYCQCEGGCSNDVLCFVPKTPELSAYLYCTLYADNFFDFMVAGSKGTKMPRGDKKQIMTYKVCMPSESQLKDFNAAVLPMFQLIESNRRENARLSLLRDTLLPKLMAGEIL